jgi:20S proteasome alpha/beta subunit
MDSLNLDILQPVPQSSASNGRTESSLEQIREQQQVQSSQTKTVKRFTTSLQTYGTIPVLAQLTSRCAGAGTAADTDFTTSLISSNLALHSLSTGRTPRVITAVTELKQYLFRHQGHIGAYLIVAGVDPTGTHLFGCQAHGSTDKLPYMTLGSGSLAAMGVLETDFRIGMEKEDAMDLVCRAVLAGIWNDLGSGGSVDLVVMEKDQV